MAEAGEDDAEPMAETQLKRFYRLWCLKESIVKALDVGVDFNLKTIEMTIQDTEETEKPILSTVMEVHGSKPELLLCEEGWSFEEALLDSDHCYAIAAQSSPSPSSFSGGDEETSTTTTTTGSIMDGSEITRFDWKELLRNAVPYPVTVATQSNL